MRMDMTDGTCGFPGGDEQARLEALDGYGLLDTPPDPAFDGITRLARRLLDVPMSTLTLIDGHRQWFKSRQGVAAQETERAPALCNHAIRQPDALVVPDTAADERFRANPFVTGEPHIRFYAGVALRTPEGGHAIGTLCAMDTKPRIPAASDLEALADLADVAMTLLELRRTATTDVLTGLRSRAAFRQEADRAVALARRHRQDLCAVMIDLDHFKQVNDRHGHAAGDDVLRACAAAMAGELRTSDVLGRIGGEEFAAILPLTGGREALAVAERIRAAVARVGVATPAGPVAVSASVGIAPLDRSVDGLDTLLARADTALYGAKEAGRNRCEIWRAVEDRPAPDLRRRVFKAGRVVFNAGRSTIDCTVRALSDREAGLDVVSSAGIPDTFKLTVEADNLSRVCRIVSKQDRHLEVRFE